MTVAYQTIHDGRRSAVIKAYITGQASDIADDVFVSLAALNEAPDLVRIVRVWWSCNAFTVTLKWNATANVEIIELADNEGDKDYECFGGLPNNAGAGRNGDILLSTNGIAAAKNGYVIVEVSKQRFPKGTT